MFQVTAESSFLEFVFLKASKSAEHFIACLSYNAVKKKKNTELIDSMYSELFF